MSRVSSLPSIVCRREATSRAHHMYRNFSLLKSKADLFRITEKSATSVCPGFLILCPALCISLWSVEGTRFFFDYWGCKFDSLLIFRVGVSGCVMCGLKIRNE